MPDALFTMIAYHSGVQFSYEKLSKESGVQKETLKKYINYLEAAFLIKVVKRTDETAKSYQGEVDLMGLDISRQKPFWAVEIKWSDLFYGNPGDLKSLNYFMDRNNLKEALTTTISKMGWKDLNEKKVYFLPVACYAYTVGENTINQSKSFCGV